MENNQAEVITILGKRGSGKTTLAANLVSRRPRLLVYDSTGHDYKIGVIIERYDDLLEYLAANEDKKFKVTYRPLHNEKMFAPFCRLVRHLENVTVLIDEVDLYASATGKIDDDFLYLLKIGRHYNIEVFCISRRPAEMNRNITAQSAQFYIFQMTEPRDIAYLKGFLGDEAEKIISLDKFAYLHYNNGMIKINGNIDNGKKGLPKEIEKEGDINA